MKKLMLLALLALLEAGCSSGPPPDLKSPCVGAAGSPCDWRPVNPEWQG